MNRPAFDPFRDRLSRDIRNALSAALPECLQSRSMQPVRQVAAGFLAQHPGPAQQAYIQQRLRDYATFLAQVDDGPADALWQGLVLWDLELFFEVHEILEHAWLRAQGQEKLLLQAMIRAAGVYIKRECGFFAAADKIAARALPVLAAQREQLAAYIDPDRLLAGLAKAEQPPPKLHPLSFSNKNRGGRLTG